MRLIGKDKILKHQKKNMGNLRLYNEINALIHQLESFNPATQRIHDIRPDADCVHADGFYFFDIQTHRTFVMLEFDEAGEATIIWVGSHADYERTFKNNKVTIEKWLRSKQYIN